MKRLVVFSALGMDGAGEGAHGLHVRWRRLDRELELGKANLRAAGGQRD